MTSNKVPGSGKTALTRPVRVILGEDAMRKPQHGTSFEMMGLMGSKAIVWDDFRWPHPPMQWCDLLNLLDNKAFEVTWISLIWKCYV